MKNRNAIAYAVLAAIVVVGALVVIVITKSGEDKAAPKPALTLTQRAGAALTRDFNAAESAQGIKIMRIAKCEKTDVANEFACAAVVSNGAQEVCGGFLFTYNGAATVPKSAQQIDAKFCA